MIFKIHIAQAPAIKIPTTKEEYDLLFKYQTLLYCMIGHHLQVNIVVWQINNGDVIRLGYDFTEETTDWLIENSESKDLMRMIRQALENQKSLPRYIELKVLKKTLTSKIGFIHCEIM